MYNLHNMHFIKRKITQQEKKSLFESNASKYLSMKVIIIEYFLNIAFVLMKEYYQ